MSTYDVNFGPDCVDEAKHDAPVFQGKIWMEPNNGRKIELNDATAQFSKKKDGTVFLRITAQKKNYDIQVPGFPRPSTGTETFSLRIRRYGLVRFYTSGEPTQSQFFRFCKKLNDHPGTIKSVDADDFYSPVGKAKRKSAISKGFEPINTLGSRVDEFKHQQERERGGLNIENGFETLYPQEKRRKLNQDSDQENSSNGMGHRSTAKKSFRRAAFSPANFYGPPSSRSRINRRSDEFQSRVQSERSQSPINSEGIKNSGQTCYMGATIQMLYFSPFKEKLQALAAKQECNRTEQDSLLKALSQIFDLRDQKKLVGVDSLKRTLGVLKTQFAEERQEDAQEFLIELLTHLKFEVTRFGCRPSESPIDAILYWTADRTVQCTSCTNKSTGTEHFTNMPLDLIDSTPNQEIPLGDLVDAFFKEHQVEWKCEKCRTSQAVSTYRMKTQPPLLLLHLKRFRLDEKAMIIRKRHDPILIPLYLDLNKWRSQFPAAMNSTSSCIAQNTGLNKEDRRQTSDQEAQCELKAMLRANRSNSNGEPPEDPPSKVIVDMKEKERSGAESSVEQCCDVPHFGIVNDENNCEAVSSHVKEEGGISSETCVRSDDPRTDLQEEKFSQNSSSASGDLRHGSGRYVLCSIVSHLGAKPMRGHYITDVYDRLKDSWTCYDDTTVTEGMEHAERRRERTAYLLAYIREDIV